MDLTHVILGDHNIGFTGLGGCVQQVGECPAVLAHPAAALDQSAIDHAVSGHHTRQEHLCDHFDNARAADAGDPRAGHGLGEARFVGPQVTANTLEARLQGVPVNPHPFNGANGGPLSAADLGALKGGTCGAGADQQSLFVGQHNLRIGTDIDHQGHGPVVAGSLRQDNPGGIGAHMPGNTGQAVQPRFSMGAQANFAGPGVDGLTGGQGKGRSTQVDRINAQQNVVHDRIGDQRDLEDILDPATRFQREICEQAVDRLPDGAGQQLGALGVHHHVGHPAHQVFPVANLGIHHPRRGQHLTGIQVTQVGSHRGRADIDRNAPGLLEESGPDGGDQLLLVDRHGDSAVGARERGLQLFQLGVGQGHPGYAPVGCQGLHQELDFTPGVFQGGLGNLHVVQACCGIQANVPGLHRLAYDLAVHLAFRRHVDHHVIQ